MTAKTPKTKPQPTTWFPKMVTGGSLMKRHIITALIPALLAANLAFAADGKPKDTKQTDEQTVKAEWDLIGLNKFDKNLGHTMHPDAQWFGDAGLGLFIHWGLSSVKAMNLSHPLIAGLPLRSKGPLSEKLRNKLLSTDPLVKAAAFKKMNPEGIMPRRYFDLAKEFNPQSYNPDLWMKAAKEAGFTYAVLTAKHHDGFAMWPSAYGDFNTKNHMGGRDLVKEWVDACRKHGIKVGLYF